MPSFVHGRNTVVLIDERDLTRYFNELSTAKGVDATETTTFGAPGGGREYIAGMREDAVTLSGFVDSVDESVPGAEGIDKILSGYFASGLTPLVSIGPAGATYGARAVMLSAHEMRYEPTSSVDDAVSFETELVCASGTGVERGVFIKALGGTSASAGATNTVDGTSLDNGATLGATSRGGIGHWHVPVATGAGSTIVGKVMHSADNLAFVPLITFATLGAVSGKQRVVVTGTVNRYVRSQVIVTAAVGVAASYTSAMTFSRL